MTFRLFPHRLLHLHLQRPDSFLLLAGRIHTFDRYASCDPSDIYSHEWMSKGSFEASATRDCSFQNSGFPTLLWRNRRSAISQRYIASPVSPKERGEPGGEKNGVVLLSQHTLLSPPFF